MEAQFDNATIKVWFNSQGTSRNFYNVKFILQKGNSALISTSEGDQHIINFSNVNMIEEVDSRKKQY